MEAIFDEVMSSNANDITKVMFAQRRVLFLEEFGYDINKYGIERREEGGREGERENEGGRERRMER